VPLLEFWKNSPLGVEQLTIEQVVASAGSGSLTDGSDCSKELRSYLAQVPSSKIASYIERCLSSTFLRSGMVLQDLINELGRRLDYEVTPGRYQGTTNSIGYDGLWVSPEGHVIIAEVKTTDAYRVSLDRIARYREKVRESEVARTPSSILIIVGRDDTGELEAQVRGSRHAWDVRLISTDSLIKLVYLKENSDGSDTGVKIRSLLTPMEYTRLDKVIDVVFTAAAEVESETSSETSGQNVDIDEVFSEKARDTYDFTENSLLQRKREDIVSAFGRARSTAFVKNSRALYWDASHQQRVACTISKRYSKRSYPYWFAYHPRWEDYLRAGSDSFLILGCMDLDSAFAIPLTILTENLGALNTTTTKEGSTYWHIHVVGAAEGAYAMLLPKLTSSLPINAFKFNIVNSEPHGPETTF
jgi:hypothetical protein